MPKKPDTPCAGGCGKLLWSSRTSLPAGQRKCQECRRQAPATDGKCTNCGKPVQPPLRTCSTACVKARRMIGVTQINSQPRLPGPCTDCGVATKRHSTAAGRFCDHCSDLRRRARYIKKNHNRRTPQRITDITTAFERELRKRAKKCPLCAVRLTSNASQPNSKHLDHIVPICIGGTHTVGNVRIICRTCNLRRPKDGSDLDGHQPTLWAQDLALAEVVAQSPRGQCGDCGTRKKRGRCWSCKPRHVAPLRALGPTAADMRASGMKWDEISDALGLKGAGNAYRVAHEYGSIANQTESAPKSA